MVGAIFRREEVFSFEILNEHEKRFHAQRPAEGHLGPREVFRDVGRQDVRTHHGRVLPPLRIGHCPVPYEPSSLAVS